MIHDPRPISENAIHRAVADALRKLRAPNVVYWHTANERRTTPQQGARLKRDGVRAGVPDFTIIVPYPLGAPYVCFLELKSEEGNLSAAQKLFRRDVESIGCCYSVARSVDEATAILKQWGAIKS